MTSRILVPFIALAAMLASATPEVAAAQERNVGPTISLNVGVMEFDLSGVDVVQTFAFRFDLPVSSRWRAEAGVEWSETIQQSDTISLYIPEVQVQREHMIGPVAPYLGVGVGLLYPRPQNDLSSPNTDLVFSGALGVRAPLPRGFGLQAEGRLRGVGERFAGSTAGFSAGLSYTF